MNRSRIEKLRQFLAQDPHDPFTRYAIALEYDAGGNAAEAASMLEALVHDSPDYVPTYQLLGTVYPKLGRMEDAKTILKRGIRAAAEQNDGHARSEMQEALDDLDG